MDPAWRAHLEALERFNAWENEQLRKLEPDLRRALAFVSEAWELTERLGTPEDPAIRREQHLGELLALRAALARADLRA